MVNLEPLMRQNFLEYASYVIVDRAIPDLRDGLKPVQRRILHTLCEMHDGRFHKVANVIGETMKLHPHGDASIGDALVVLANKEFFIERQGNFGNLVTGHKAAAPRYIECRLSPLALDTLFNKALTEYLPSYDGRKQEPAFLPAKLPVLLMIGAEGIAVGMATRILPHNLPEILAAQIALLRKQRVEIYPDFLQGGQVDVDEYDDGRGRVRVRARIEERSSKKLVITEIPYGTTTESLIASIESAAQKGRVKISSIDDFTTDDVEIELTLARGVSAEEALPQLYAYTDCEVSISSNIVVIDGDRPAEMTVSEVLARLTENLKGLLKAELEHERGQLEDRQHWLTLEQIFIEKRVYKRIERAKTADKVRQEVKSGMAPHAKQFRRPMTDEDITRLLGLPIRRISAFDIAKQQAEMQEIADRIRQIGRALRNMVKTTIGFLQQLHQRVDDDHPRRTEITTFEAVDKRAVARQNIRLTYDSKTSFFGSDVRGSEHAMTVTEYDHVLAVSNDGTYRIMNAPSKVLLPGKVLYLDIFDVEEGASFYVVYRDKKKTAYGKLVQILKFIRNKEYRLAKEGSRIDMLLPVSDDPPGIVHMKYVPAKRQRIKEGEFDLAELDYTGVTARGTRLAPKPVSRLKLLKPN